MEDKILAPKEDETFKEEVVVSEEKLEGVVKVEMKPGEIDRSKISMAEIRKRCTRPGMEDCKFRKFSYYVTYPILHTNVTPTQITWLWLVLGTVSLPFLVFGDYWLTIIGVALWTIGFLFDHIDGSLARYKKQYSDKGYYLDEVGSFVLISFFLFALGVGGWQKTGQWYWLVVGGVATFSWLMFQVMHFFTVAKLVEGKKKSKASEKHPNVHSKYTLLTKIFPGHWDEITYLLIILAIVGYAEWTIAYFAFVYTGMWAGRAVYDFFYSYGS
jgi:phosphatidylglycerophosphate synthase